LITFLFYFLVHPTACAAHKALDGTLITVQQGLYI